MKGNARHVHLQEPIWADALSRPLYQDGQVLRAIDLARDQEAAAHQRMQIAQGIGWGIISGLEVSLGDPLQPMVRVSPGLAFNRLGQPLHLAEEVELHLTSFPSEERETAAILLLEPAKEERAGGESMGTRAEGVQFHLHWLPRSMVGEGRRDPRLRNRLAYRMMSTPAHTRNPFQPRLPGLLQDLVPSPEAIPLALLFGSAKEIDWLDMWAVRRLKVPHASVYPSPERLTEVEAAFHQFQQHLAEFPAGAGLQGLRAEDHFAWLPPVGYLPGGAQGVDPATFFAGFPISLVNWEPDLLPAEVGRLRLAEPICVAERPHVGIGPLEDGSLLYMRLPAAPSPAPEPPVPEPERPTPPPPVPPTPPSLTRPPETKYTHGWKELADWRWMILLPDTVEPGPLPAAMQLWRLLRHPPADVDDWLYAWGQYLAELHPQWEINPASVQVWVDPNYRAKTADGRPHAYAVLGRSGVRVQLTLIPKQRGWLARLFGGGPK